MATKEDVKKLYFDLRKTFGALLPAYKALEQARKSIALCNKLQQNISRK